MKNISILFILIFLTLSACKTPKESSSNTEGFPSEDSFYMDEAADLPGSHAWDMDSEEPKVRPIYNPSNTILTDLIHTKLEVSFNWNESQLNGKATITAKPHFYESDELILDARGMDILKVQMKGNDLEYTYEDALKLNINLGRVYKNTEEYTLTIEYISSRTNLKWEEVLQ